MNVNAHHPTYVMPNNRRGRTLMSLSNSGVGDIVMVMVIGFVIPGLFPFGLIAALTHGLARLIWLMLMAGSMATMVAVGALYIPVAKHAVYLRPNGDAPTNRDWGSVMEKHASDPEHVESEVAKAKRLLAEATARREGAR